jgi:hypothetical protein
MHLQHVHEGFFLGRIVDGDPLAGTSAGKKIFIPKLLNTAYPAAFWMASLELG